MEITVKNETPSDELWRPVVGYENRYMISNLGRVCSLPSRTSKGGLIVPYQDSKGYWHIKGSLSGVVKNLWVHRMVAEAFLPNSVGGEVNHKDCNPANNKLDNLEWCTHQENVLHSVFNKRTGRGKYTPTPTLTSSQVEQLTRLKGIYPSSYVAKLFKTSQRYVYYFWANERS